MREGGKEGRMRERDSMADWVLESESFGGGESVVVGSRSGDIANKGVEREREGERDRERCSS